MFRKSLIMVSSLFIMMLSACESKNREDRTSNQNSLNAPTHELSTEESTKEMLLTEDSSKQISDNNLTVALTDDDTIESSSSNQIQPIIWYADITQDGIDEKIVVDLTYVINQSETGEEKTVSVYSGKTGELIWTGHADTIQLGWNGIYVYNDGKNDYLLLWRPTIYQGRANFSYQIFSLTETGEIIEYASNTIEFNMNLPKEVDIDALSTYIDDINRYLKNSYVLIDTNNGIPVYSTKDGKIVNTFDGSAIIEEIKSRQNN